MINVKPFLVIYCILKENKTHYKVSHFLPVNPNPSLPPIAAYLPVCRGGKAWRGGQCGKGARDVHSGRGAQRGGQFGRRVRWKAPHLWKTFKEKVSESLGSWRSDIWQFSVTKKTKEILQSISNIIFLQINISPYQEETCNNHRPSFIKSFPLPAYI
jgi:hypothetical protein